MPAVAGHSYFLLFRFHRPTEKFARVGLATPRRVHDEQECGPERTPNGPEPALNLVAATVTFVREVASTAAAKRSPLAAEVAPAREQEHACRQAPSLMVSLGVAALGLQLAFPPKLLLERILHHPVDRDRFAGLGREELIRRDLTGARFTVLRAPQADF